LLPSGPTTVRGGRHDQVQQRDLSGRHRPGDRDRLRGLSHRCWKNKGLGQLSDPATAASPAWDLLFSHRPTNHQFGAVWPCELSNNEEQTMSNSTATLAILALTMFATHSPAQDDPKPQEGGTGRPRPQVEQRVNVDFKGGTLAELLDQIRKASDANILSSADANNVLLPTVTLKDALVGEALEGIATIASNRAWQVNARREGLGVYSLRVIYTSAGNGSSPAQKPRLRVYSMADLTTQPAHLPAEANVAMSPATVLTAIETCLAVLGSGQSKPTIRYHEDANLLFIYGMPSQIEAAEQTMQSLEQNVRHRRVYVERTGLMDAPPASGQTKRVKAK